jgi:hypothetical protein
VWDLCEIWDDRPVDWVVEGGVRKVRCRLVARLPMLQPAEVIVAATATVDGRVAVLATPRAASPGQYHGAPVYAHDGDLTWWPIELTGPAVGHSVLDLLPGGEILVVGSRSQRFRDGTVEDNAHVFDPGGAHLRSFCLGDGIERIGVDGAGTIWVGYFDEGVFGNPRLGRSNRRGRTGALRRPWPPAVGLSITGGRREGGRLLRLERRCPHHVGLTA